MNTQAALFTREARDMMKGEQLNHAKSIANVMLEGVGIKTKGFKPGTAAAEKYDQFVGRLSEALDAFRSENKRRPSDLDIRTLTGSLLVEGKQQGTGWLFDDTVRLFQSADRTKFRAGVPDVERPKIIADYTALRGKAPTEAQIADIYTADQIRRAGLQK